MIRFYVGDKTESQWEGEGRVEQYSLLLLVWLTHLKMEEQFIFSKIMESVI